jgi:DNA-binding NtrC family response regulator
MSSNPKKILLVDLDDARRRSRIRLLEHAGYEVSVRTDHISAESLNHEGFDLIVIALHYDEKLAIEYSNRLSRSNPTLPVLLLLDRGVFVPRKTVRPTIETGNPKELLEEIASLLAGSSHIREL